MECGHTLKYNTGVCISTLYPRVIRGYVIATECAIPEGQFHDTVLCQEMSYSHKYDTGTSCQEGSTTARNCSDEYARDPIAPISNANANHGRIRVCDTAATVA